MKIKQYQATIYQINDAIKLAEKENDANLVAMLSTVNLVLTAKLASDEKSEIANTELQ